MKKKSLILSCFLLFGCATALTPGQQAVLSSATGIAQVVVPLAAAAYGGPLAGTAAAAILNGVGVVVQAYKGYTLPQAVVAASAGLPAVGAALAPLVTSKVPVSQADANAFFKAATLTNTVATALTKP